MNHRHPPEFAGRDAANLTPFLTSLLAGESLSEESASSAFEAIMTGEAHHAEMGALLALLATRLPTTDELTGAARVMRDKVDSLETGFESNELLDTAGTGGAPKTFNVSTAETTVNTRAEKQHASCDLTSNLRFRQKQARIRTFIQNA